MVDCGYSFNGQRWKVAKKRGPNQWANHSESIKCKNIRIEISLKKKKWFNLGWLIVELAEINYMFHGVHRCTQSQYVDWQKRKYDATLNVAYHFENPVGQIISIQRLIIIFIEIR